MVIEVRDQPKRDVSFAALHYVDGKILWENFRLEESWWVDLSGIVDGKIFFTVYLDAQNPDTKGILVHDSRTRKLLWWNNDFSLLSIGENAVTGVSTRLGNRVHTLDSTSGKECVDALTTPADTQALYPVQYSDGSEHFNTVRTFLNEKLNLSPVLAFEYLEFNSRIFVSYYVSENGLANYLLAIGPDGRVQLHEKLDEHLKGIGLDTFFVLSGCLFFVKNRVELVSYFL